MKLEARAAHVKGSHQRNQTMPWTFPHGGRLEQSPVQPRGHGSPRHVGEGWGNGQESSDLGYIYSAVSILCSHRESHRASSPAAPRAAWEIKAALMGGEAATAPLKGNAGAAPAPHSSLFSAVLPSGFIPHRSQTPSSGGTRPWEPSSSRG